MATNAYDVVVIGAGVSGCSIARELAKLSLSACVVEAEEDVCCGTSKANSAIVHAGFDAMPGTLMAKLNVEGSALMGPLCEELGVDFQKIGSLVVCTSEASRPALEALLARGIENGVKEIRIVEKEEIRSLEPNVSDSAVCALWAPTAGIVNPFQLTVALAENAKTNGVDFRFNERVEGFERGETGRGWRIVTSRGALYAHAVVNAAGVHADELHNLVCEAADHMTITPRRGQYYVLDTTVSGYVKHTVFALPGPLGKGILVTPTTSGNVLVGPTAEDIADKSGIDVTPEALAQIREKSALTMRDVPFRETIRTFSGLRAHRPEHDFAIGEVKGAPGFIDCAAIESPGLTSAPAIGRMVAGIVAECLGNPGANTRFEARRERPPRFEDMDPATWAELIKSRPDYGHVVCRCRRVTEGQIVDAIHAPIPATSLDAIKRRTEAGMGRCQGGFCTPKIMEILAREVPGLDLQNITKSGPGSPMALGLPKEGRSDA